MWQGIVFRFFVMYVIQADMKIKDVKKYCHEEERNSLSSELFSKRKYNHV